MLLYVAYLDKVFSNLNGIECCAFLYLVAAKPECHSVVVCYVLANSADVDVVLAGSEQRHWVCLCRWVVEECDAVGVLDRFLNFGNGEWLVGLNPYCLAV